MSRQDVTVDRAKGPQTREAVSRVLNQCVEGGQNQGGYVGKIGK